MFIKKATKAFMLRIVQMFTHYIYLDNKSKDKCTYQKQVLKVDIYWANTTGLICKVLKTASVQ